MEDPISTEQVENVKTFFRIILVLFSIGTVYVLENSAEPYILSFIGYHIAQKGRELCDRFILFQSGAIRYITSSTFLPIYVCGMFSFLKKKHPSILTRLGTGMSLFLAGVLSIPITDIVGHTQLASQANNNNLCMFAIHFDHYKLYLPSLKMHWASLIPINVLLGIGSILVWTTVFEFIVAQSPHSMKGLVVGLFFVISGLFQLLSSFALLPFSFGDIWQSKHMKEHHPVTDCGFGYFLFICVVSAIGLVLFLVVIKKYEYRRRDDRPFDHRFADKFYENEIKNREQHNHSYNNE